MQNERIDYSGVHDQKISNMKNSIFLIMMLMASNVLFAEDKKTRKASLTEATVYTNGVQLRSKVYYTATNGINEIIIEGISGNIDPKTIQVSATGKVVILDSKYSLYYPKLSHEETADEVKKVRIQISKLKDSILYLSYDISDIQDEIYVYTEAKNILKTNGVMRSQGKVNDSIILLKEALELYTFKMNQLNKKLSGLRKTKNTKMKIDKRMNERLNRLKNHLGSIGNQNNNNKPIPRITVTLSANTSTSGNISFSYLASGAGWSPLYDIRSESSQGKIFMNYKAEVYQNTGLDWKKIKLNISTNNPYANKQARAKSLGTSYIQYKKEYKC